MVVYAMARLASALELTAEEEAELNRRVRAATASVRDILRARIVLQGASGTMQLDVVRKVGAATKSVNKWSQRFKRLGLDGLAIRPDRGVGAAISPVVVE